MSIIKPLTRSIHIIGVFARQLGSIHSCATPSIFSASRIALDLFCPVLSAIPKSGTEYVPDTLNAWYFYRGLGYQGLTDKAYPSYAIAVRSGDVAAPTATVPGPQTLALALMAMGGAMVARRKRPGRGFDFFVPHYKLLPIFKAWCAPKRRRQTLARAFIAAGCTPSSVSSDFP